MNPAVLSSNTNIYITFFASILIWLMFFGLAILWVIDGRVKKELVLHTVIAVMVAWVITEIIKTLFPTLRPYQVNGMPPITISLFKTNGSFPSSHSAVAFSIAASVYLHNKKIGALFALCAVLVGIGRVIGNVHYPFDIIAGAAIGIIVAYSISKMHVNNLIAKRKTKKRHRS
ncbi:phosphatase PAP2 family protein [Candidatus Woesebacteria bacterium]|nr:MAG: phosphatase PAP2 family protein [Candidatus Woesebacteria bacterium]